nr:hypothetical protein [Rhodoferax sp. UBA5149]
MLMRHADLPPAGFVDLDIELFGGSLNALPCRVTLGIAYVDNLIETRDRVAHMARIFERFFALRRKGELSGTEIVALLRSQFCH